VPPTGTAPASDTPDGTVFYDIFYTGAGFTENADNLGNFIEEPQTTTFPNTDIATAVGVCATFTDGIGFDSFAMYFLMSTCSYSCTAYLGTNTNPTYFNVANPDVVLGYGYSL